MRRKDREIDISEALNLLDQCEYAVMSVILPGQAPYGVPLSIVRINGSIYFHSAHEGNKICALRSNPSVCVTCVGRTRRMEDEFSIEYESAIVFGTATEVLDECEKVKVLKALCERYAPLHMNAFEEESKKSLKSTAVWRIQIEGITGKRKRGVASLEKV